MEDKEGIGMVRYISYRQISYDQTHFNNVYMYMFLYDFTYIVITGYADDIRHTNGQYFARWLLICQDMIIEVLKKLDAYVSCF